MRDDSTGLAGVFNLDTGVTDVGKIGGPDVVVMEGSSYDSTLLPLYGRDVVPGVDTGPGGSLVVHSSQLILVLPFCF